MILALCLAFSLASSLGGAGIGTAAADPTTDLRPIAADVELGRQLRAAPVTVPPTLDGAISDPSGPGGPSAPFLDSRSGAPATTPTFFDITYDDRHLYLRFHAFEKGQETQRHAVAGTTARDDEAIFDTDSIELFLQPDGRGTPYYQIVANTAGAIFDERWTEPGTREGWDGEGIRAAGQVYADTWTLEMAVPFEALGRAAPADGERWRVNACRTEIPFSGEYTCWAPTRGFYHLPERFGFLEFGAGSGTAATPGKATARGRLVEDDGMGIATTAVQFPGGTAHTDSAGEFTLRGLSAGQAFVRVESPRYHAYAAFFEVDEQMEILPDIALHRRDPYLPAFELPAAGLPGTDQAVTWLHSSLEEPIDMAMRPGPADVAGDLDILVTPGETESVAVAFYAHEVLEEPSLTVTGLRGSDGRQLEAEVRWTQRLLRRVQYTRTREDAVFSWRFLWHEAPASIDAGHVRHLVVTLRPPATSPPGMYGGELVLRSRQRIVARLPLRVRIPDFHLREPAKRVGAYYRYSTDDEQVRRELHDIHDHGGRVLVWHEYLGYAQDDKGEVTYDVSRVRRAVRLQREAGIGPPYLVATNPRRAAALAGLQVEMTPAFADQLAASDRFRRIYGGGLRALNDLEEELGTELVYTWLDEIFDRGRFEPWMAIARMTREFSANRVYITHTSARPDLLSQADPYVDVRGYHGQYLDRWLEEGHTFQELARELEAAGDEAWTYYNVIGVDVTPEWVRLTNGYWLWASPLAAHTPWIYYAYGGNPFDDLDSDRHDFAYAAPHPSRPEMVSTLQWEAFREGWDDLRYLTTLEAVVDSLTTVAPDDANLIAARAVLADWRQQDPRVEVQARRLDAAAFHQRRLQMTGSIEELLGR